MDSIQFQHPRGHTDEQGFSYWPAPVKLNLELRILGQRADGYHNLQTLFQLLDIGDELWIKKISSKELNLKSNFNEEVPAEDNLIIKAARLLIQESNQPELGADIKLIKKMPSGAGLGAGSSDAASTLVALNHLWNLQLTEDKLCQIGARLGADVPVFIQGFTAWAEGIGEILSPTKLPEKHYLILYPHCKINTGEIFSHSALTRNDKPIKLRATRPETVIKTGLKNFVLTDFSIGYNAFQPLVTKLYPEVQEALEFLNQFGQAMLTGTGSCVFLTFDNEREVRKISALCKQRWLTLEARGINTSPLLES